MVAILPAGMQILVEGCLSDYRWCDVVAGPNRGWVYAGNIVYPYEGADVPVLTYGAVIGLGIITFSVELLGQLLSRQSLVFAAAGLDPQAAARVRGG